MLRIIKDGQVKEMSLIQAKKFIKEAAENLYSPTINILIQNLCSLFNDLADEYTKLYNRRKVEEDMP